MKECPKCGRMNFSNVINCMGCNEPLPIVPEQTHAAPVPKEGMHWFWAALIMGVIRFVGSWIAGKLAETNPYDISYEFLWAVDMAIVYFSLWVWVRLTVDRYFRSGVWTFFMYLWLIIGPIITAGSYTYLIVVYGNGNTNALLIISLICIIIAPLVFASFRKRNLYRLQEEQGRIKTGDSPISSPSKPGLHWAFALLIMLGISYGSELLGIVISKALIDSYLSGATWASLYYTSYSYIRTYFVMILSGISIWMWVKLTTRRYNQMRPWYIFTYSWIAVSRCISISNIYFILYIIQFKPSFSVILSNFVTKYFSDILFILMGFIAYTIHRNNKKAREAHTSTAGQP